MQNVTLIVSYFTAFSSSLSHSVFNSSFAAMPNIFSTIVPRFADICSNLCRVCSGNSSPLHYIRSKFSINQHNYICVVCNTDSLWQNICDIDKNLRSYPRHLRHLDFHFQLEDCADCLHVLQFRCSDRHFPTERCPDCHHLRQFYDIKRKPCLQQP